MLKFKVGDKVRVVKIDDENPDESVNKFFNSIGEIKRCYENSEIRKYTYPYDVWFNDKEYLPMKESEIEAISN